MPSFYKKQSSGGKRWLPCRRILASALYYVGSNYPIIPRQNCLPWMALRLRGRTKHCHDIAFLFVWAEDEVTGARNYGLSTIWVNPSQARVPSMVEAVGKLTACASSGPDWPYALVQLHEGTCHVPLPKEGHMGILLLQGEGATPCRWVSQLEVCHLLTASLKIIYPIVLNGHDEPIITSLPELLASSISLTVGEPVYLKMDIPPP